MNYFKNNFGNVVEEKKENKVENKKSIIGTSGKTPYFEGGLFVIDFGNGKGKYGLNESNNLVIYLEEDKKWVGVKSLEEYESKSDADKKWLEELKKELIDLKNNELLRKRASEGNDIAI